MPGLVGIITRMPRERAERDLNLMVGSIRHESSYAIGTWSDERLGIYAGWAVRRNSFSDEMPIANEREDVVLLFSGEDYPAPDLRQQLKDRGHRLDTKESSYLVHVYEDDPAFPVSLNGRFHGLLTDRSLGSSILFNDRYGMSRIYYCETEDAFYFAAEAKAILAVRPELRRIDPRAMGEFVACGCVLENRTLFKDIHVLPCASAWVLRNGSLEKRNTYFEPREWEEQSPLNEETYYQELRSVLAQNLPRYFDRGERIGMSVTGGLDTRIVMASHKSTPGELPCYSFGGMYRDCQDVTLARRIAHACKQPYTVIPVGREFLSQFSHYAERTVYLTDGCVDVSHSPDLFANERAARIAPVRMTGNYGSEVLRSSRAFKPVSPAPGIFTRDFLGNVDLAATTYNEILRVHPLTFAVFRQAPWHHYGLLALEQTQLTIRSPFLDNDLVRTVFRSPPLSLAGADISLRLINDGDKSLMRIRTDRGLAGEHWGLSALMLRSYLEFTAKAEYAYDYGMPQWLATIDHIIAHLHPERVFLGRHKFYHFRVWYRDLLADYVKELLLDDRALARPYLDRKVVDAMVLDHVKGKRNATLSINKLITLELIHRLFIDSETQSNAATVPSSLTETFTRSPA
jgi:asparagine synthase (glutamine-hydrolysing)